MALATDFLLSSSSYITTTVHILRPQCKDNEPFLTGFLEGSLYYTIFTTGINVFSIHIKTCHLLLDRFLNSDDRDLIVRNKNINLVKANLNLHLQQALHSFVCYLAQSYPKESQKNSPTKTEFLWRHSTAWLWDFFCSTKPILE